MASQAVLVLLAVGAAVGVASAGFLGSPAVSYAAAPAVHAAPALPGGALRLAAAREDAEYDPNPQYSFSYSVSDALTGDAKQQAESRSGDVVQGSYSVLEADGAVRTVEYSAAPGAGFNAVVSRSGAGPAPAHVVAPAARVAVPAPAPLPAGRLVPLPAALPRLAPLPAAAPAAPLLVARAQPLVASAAPALVAAPARAAPPPPAGLYGAPLKSSHTAVTTSHASYSY